MLWKKPRQILQLLFLGARFQRLLDLTHRFPGRKTGWTGGFCWLLSGVITVDGWWFRNPAVPAVEGLFLFIYRGFFGRICVTNHEVWGGVRFSR